jgi:hypothetical protein
MGPRFLSRVAGPSVVDGCHVRAAAKLVVVRTGLILPRASIASCNYECQLFGKQATAAVPTKVREMKMMKPIVLWVAGVLILGIIVLKVFGFI